MRIVGDDESSVGKAEKAVKTLCGSYSRGEVIEEQNLPCFNSRARENNTLHLLLLESCHRQRHREICFSR